MTLLDHIHTLAVPPTLDVRGEWVHCSNAKTGSTSINRHALGGRRVDRKNDPLLWQRVWDKSIAPNLGGLTLFTFVRNSWDRVLSAFCFRQQVSTKNTIGPEWRFADYVKQRLAVEGTEIDIHFAPQYDSVCFQGEPIPGMFVGRFERLQDDWATIAKRIGAPPEVPHANATRHAPYTEHYDDTSREIVGLLYKKEIEHLGYQFGK